MGSGVGWGGVGGISGGVRDKVTRGILFYTYLSQKIGNTQNTRFLIPCTFSSDYFRNETAVLLLGKSSSGQTKSKTVQ